MPTQQEKRLGNKKEIEVLVERIFEKKSVKIMVDNSVELQLDPWMKIKSQQTLDNQKKLTMMMATSKSKNQTRALVKSKKLELKSTKSETTKKKKSTMKTAIEHSATTSHRVANASTIKPLQKSKTASTNKKSNETTTETTAKTTMKTTTKMTTTAKTTAKTTMKTTKKMTKKTTTKMTMKTTTKKTTKTATKTKSNFEKFVANNSPLNPNLDAWRIFVDGPKFSKIYLFSAFYDTRKRGKDGNDPVVRINAILQYSAVNAVKNKIVCLFMLSDGTKHWSPFRLIKLPENFGLKYTSANVDCNVEMMNANVTESIKDKRLTLENVTIEWKHNLNKSDKIHDWLQINRPGNSSGMQDLAVCVKPIHYHWDRAVWFVEFMEMYRIQGAEHFFFYISNIGDHVRKAMDLYINMNMTTTFSWDLPLQSQKEIRTVGMFTALNDCVMRGIGRFKFIALVDFDEYILSSGNKTLLELVSQLSAEDEKRGSFNFANVFHYLYWENTTLASWSGEGNTSAPYLLTQSKLRRKKKPHKHHVRSKYVARPEAVSRAGNHLVQGFCDGRCTSLCI